MSSNVVQTIIHKAVSDADFRAALISYPSETLADFDLTAEERASLSKLDASVFNGGAIELEERLSRAKYAGN